MSYYSEVSFSDIEKAQELLRKIRQRSDCPTDPYHKALYIIAYARKRMLNSELKPIEFAIIADEAMGKLE
jgi:hypothetical protein